MPYSNLEPNPFKRNRGFYRRIRNLNFEKSLQLFQEVHQKLHSYEIQDSNTVLKPLKKFMMQLSRTHDYANAAIRGFRQKKLSSYREDKLLGVMEEEMVLLHFISEMLLSCQYLIGRIESDANILDYRQDIQKRETDLIKKGGFLQSIYRSIDASMVTAKEEIQDLARLLSHRMAVTSEIYTIIKIQEQLPLH